MAMAYPKKLIPKIPKKERCLISDYLKQRVKQRAEEKRIRKGMKRIRDYKKSLAGRKRRHEEEVLARLRRNNAA